MSAIYPLSVHRRIERQWAERIKSLQQIHDKIVVATETILQRELTNDGSLISTPPRVVVETSTTDRSAT